MANKKRKTPGESKPAFDSKWFRDRATDLGLSLADLARQLGTYPVQVQRIVAGDRRLRLEDVGPWAKVLEVTPAVIYQRAGYEWPAPVARVIGQIRGNGRISIFPASQQSEIPSPDDSGIFSALVVDSPHAALALFQGWHVFYEPSETVRPDAFGRLSVIELGDHAAAIVGVLDRAAQLGSSRVRVFGDQEVIDSRELISATPVRWLRAG